MPSLMELHEDREALLKCVRAKVFGVEYATAVHIRRGLGLLEEFKRMSNNSLHQHIDSEKEAWENLADNLREKRQLQEELEAAIKLRLSTRSIMAIESCMRFNEQSIKESHERLEGSIRQFREILNGNI